MTLNWIGPVAGILAAGGMWWDARRAVRRDLMGWTGVLGALAGGMMLIVMGIESASEPVSSCVFAGIAISVTLIPTRVLVRVVAGREGLRQFVQANQEEDVAALDLDSHRPTLPSSSPRRNNRPPGDAPRMQGAERK